MMVSYYTELLHDMTTGGKMIQEQKANNNGCSVSRVTLTNPVHNRHTTVISHRIKGLLIIVGQVTQCD